MMIDPLVLTLVVLGGILVALAWDRISAEIVMLAALLVLVAGGAVGVKDALAGFANEAVLTIGALFVVGAGLQSTGAIEYLSRLLLGRPKQGTSYARMLAPVAGLSAFMNNTPLVAFMLPIFVNVAKKLRVSPSKLLIPLSYAAVLGGTCTLIGTSTNLVTDGILRRAGMDGLRMFDLTWIGLPITIVGLAYLGGIASRLLPNREDLLEYAEAHPREYTVELIVRPQCPLVGVSIRRSGLRDMPGLYLYAIERKGERLSPVEPQEKIEVEDLLCFSGVLSHVVDLQKIRGLDPVEHYGDERRPEADSFDSMEGVPVAARAAPRQGRQLYEVVISPRSPLNGRSVKEADFRARYQASIMAVHRSGQKLSQKIGQIVLQPGDTLLVDAGEDFLRRWRNSPDFILVSGLDDSAPIAHHRAWLAMGIFLAVVIGMTAATKYAAIVALAGAALMIVTGCLPTAQAHRSVELSVLLLVAAALGVGAALDSSGAAEWIATGVVGAFEPLGPIAVLAVFVVLTGLLTELLSNNATAAVMAVLALATAEKMGIAPQPLVIAVTLTASYGFATPIGYQTNLMVLNPGGYKFSDYLKVGIPLDLICWALTIALVPLVWPLSVTR